MQNEPAQLITEAMLRRGYSEERIRKFLGGNLLRFSGRSPRTDCRFYRSQWAFTASMSFSMAFRTRPFISGTTSFGSSL